MTEQQQQALWELDPQPRSRTLRGEFLGPPRRNRRAQVMVACFGLLLVANVAIPALSRAEATPGLTMTVSGLMVMGFAELLDPKLQRFVIALRFAGAAVAVFGLALRFI